MVKKLLRLLFACTICMYTDIRGTSEEGRGTGRGEGGPRVAAVGEVWKRRRVWHLILRKLFITF